MTFDITPSRFWTLPVRWQDWDEEDNIATNSMNNLSISEDEKNVYVDAAIPGVDPKDVDITFDKGMLWIKGESKEEEKDKAKKFYRKATSSFSYRVAVPGDIDPNVEPQADIEHGVVKITFTKSPKSQPKKIEVKSK
ncbi:MAG TPA: Hsp20 family protein [Candidatus Saccharimonadales bacterium]|nr:Hsp20 family protein [Candidatus Saccharimonadales bacterium]